MSRLDYPWTVRVVFSCQSRSGDLLKWPICGGAVITKRFIATASHCVSPLIVVNGTININYEYVCTGDSTYYSQSKGSFQKKKRKGNSGIFH